MKIHLLSPTIYDIADAANFYNQQEPGIGTKFLDSIYRDIESLPKYAGIHPIKYGCYRLLAKTFPYAVYYLLKKDAVFIVAVLDCRRDPADLNRIVRHRIQ